MAGSRRGRAPEATLADTPWSTELPWRPEVDAARRARADADADSRDPKMLARFHRQARSELGAAGSPVLAAKSETAARGVGQGSPGRGRQGPGPGAGLARCLRLQQVPRRAGPAGDPRRAPVTIVRPSIIESALAEPQPGWIRGFRMADPVIISYAKGLLKEFPGVPEGIIDVIPVDLVVASIMAVAARGP